MTEVLPLDARIVETPRAVAAATPTIVRLKKGLRKVRMRGPRALQPGAGKRPGQADAGRVAARATRAAACACGSITVGR